MGIGNRHHAIAQIKSHFGKIQTGIATQLSQLNRTFFNLFFSGGPKIGFGGVSEDGVEKVFDADRALEYFKKTDDFDWIEKTQALTRRLKKVKVKSVQKYVDGVKRRVYIMDVKEFKDLCERFKI